LRGAKKSVSKTLDLIDVGTHSRFIIAGDVPAEWIISRSNNLGKAVIIYNEELSLLKLHEFFFFLYAKTLLSLTSLVIIKGRLDITMWSIIKYYSYKYGYFLVYVGKLKLIGSIKVNNLSVLDDRLSVWNNIPRDGQLMTPYKFKISDDYWYTGAFTSRNIHKAFGHYFRRYVYEFLSDIAGDEKLVYSLGDEVESVVDGLAVRRPIVHYGDYVKQISTLDNWKMIGDDNILYDKHKKQTESDKGEKKESRGQRKLKSVTHPFIIRFIPKKVLYIGAYPGWNLIDIVESYPMIQWTLVDPKRIEWTNHNVVFINKAVDYDWILTEMPKYDFIINDARADRSSINWEGEIAKWWNINLVILERCVKENKKCILKLRWPDKGLEKLTIPESAEIILQPFAKYRSRETRLFYPGVVSKGNKTYTHDEYVKILGGWNMARYNDPSVDGEQEHALLSYAIRRQDILGVRLRNQHIVSLWAVSNVRNVTSNAIDVMNKLGENQIITVWPNLIIAKNWPPGQNHLYFWRDYYTFELIVGNFRVFVTREKGETFYHSEPLDKPILSIEALKKIIFYDMIVTEGKVNRGADLKWVYVDEVRWTGMIGNERVANTIIFDNKKGKVYKDYCPHPSEFIGKFNFWMINDYVQKPTNGIGFDPVNPLANLWVVVENVLNDDYQTIWNSQTHWAKVCTSVLREEFSLNDDTMHIFRRRALAEIFKGNMPVIRMLFAPTEYMVIMDKRVSGAYKTRSGILPIAVSGHMINLLIASSFGKVDISRYVRTLDKNRKIWNSTDGEFDNLRMMGALAENNLEGNRLWHNWIEYFIAVRAYQLVCEEFKLNVNVRAVLWVLKWLYSKEVLNDKMFIKSMGWQAAKFSISRLDERGFWSK